MRNQTAALLTTMEAARRLGLSDERIRQFVKDGTLEPAETPFGYYLFDPHDIETLRMKRRQKRAEAS